MGDLESGGAVGGVIGLLELDEVLKRSLIDTYDWGIGYCTVCTCHGTWKSERQRGSERGSERGPERGSERVREMISVNVTVIKKIDYR